MPKQTTTGNTDPNDALPAVKPEFSGAATNGASKSVANTNAYLAGGAARFPSGAPGPNAAWYEKHLEGKPFIITSPIEWRTVSSKFQASPVEQAVCQVRFVQDTDGTLSTTPVIAVFQGRYLLNQLRSLEPSHLYGGLVWTVERNHDMPVTPQGLHPFMLAVFDGVYPADEESW